MKKHIRARSAAPVASRSDGQGMTIEAPNSAKAFGYRNVGIDKISEAVSLSNIND